MNNWCVFYVIDYKGGELREWINITEKEVIEVVSCDFAFLWEYLDEQGKEGLTEDKLWELWTNWYEREEEHYEYAYDGSSEKQVYRIENNQLVSNFPSKESIINAMKNYVNNW